MLALVWTMAVVGGSTGGAVTLLPPAVIVALCVVAGVGTVMLLPGRRSATVARLGLVVLLAAGLILAALILRPSARPSAGDIYFWVFSAIAVISALRMITHSKPVYSALYFVLTVIASAGLFVLLWAEFMAAALVLIYAGAILVTYVFVIMLAAQAQGDGSGQASYDMLSREPVLASAVGFTLMGLMLFLIFEKAGTLQLPAVPVSPAHAVMTKATGDTGSPSAVRELGKYLFSTQAVSLELAGLLLTISMVGAVIVARRPAGLVEDAAVAAEATTAKPVEAGLSDDPHAIPVTGVTKPKSKAYPEA